MKRLTCIIYFAVTFINVQGSWYDFWPNVNQVQMLSQTIGFAAGNHGLLISYNGTQWSTISTGIREDFTTLGFTSQTNGWLGTAQGNIYHYDGSNFQLVYSTGSSVTKIAFYNSQIGYALISPDTGYSTILKCNGTTWSIDYEASGICQDLAIRDSSDIWIVGSSGYNGTTYCYRNTGSGWSSYNLGFALDINPKLCFNNGYGFLTYVSLNFPQRTYFYNGSAWVSIAYFGGTNIWGNSANNVWLLKPGEISHYNGNTWSNYSYQRSSYVNLNSINFTDTSNGWAVGDEKTIINIKNDSIIAYYTKLPVLDLVSLNSVKCNSDSDVWAVGTDGYIFHYNGEDWVQVNSPSQYALNSVCFSALDSGWAVGGGGTILKYDGNNWLSYQSPTTGTLYAINFSNFQNGWIAGDSGILTLSSSNWISKSRLPSNCVFTCNEDFTWFGTISTQSEFYQIYLGTVYNLPFPLDYNQVAGICFIDSSSGFVISNASTLGYFLHYTASNGWQENSSGSLNQHGLSCIDDNDCWVVSNLMSYGSIMYYNGATWENQDIFSPLNDATTLNSISMLNDSMGWIVGDHGQIYYTRDGGHAVTFPTFVTGLNQAENYSYENLSIFPNPSNKEIEVTGLTGGEPTTIEIFDMSGQVVLRTITQTNNLIMDISSLASSIYVLQAKSPSSFNSQKLIVQH